MSHNTDLEKILSEAMAAFADHRYRESASALTTLLDLDPGHKTARMTRGAVYMKLGNNAGAIADFSAVVANDSKYARAYHLRGLARETGGDDSGALADFSRAIDLSPAYGAAYYSRAALYNKLGRDDEAAADMETVAMLAHGNLESFAVENNIWQTQHMRVEAALETELER